MLDVYESDKLSNVRASGLVGLSPAKDYRNKRFLDDLKEQNVIDYKVFSFFITNYFEALSQITEQQSQDANPTIESIAPGSKLIIGGYNVEEYTPEGENTIYWLKTSDVQSNYWTIDMDRNSVFLDASPMVSINSVAEGVVLDSGTSFIITPVDDYEAILRYFLTLGYAFEDISASTQVKQTDCNDYQYQEFPDLIFYINGTTFKLPKTSYLYRLRD